MAPPTATGEHRTMEELTRLEMAHHVDLPEPGSEFQRRARLLQAIWREERGYPIGRYKPPGREERPMGSLLAMPWAKESLRNYLTDPIREIVYSEVVGPNRDKQKVYKPPRIFSNLLSSQPLCFNLAGELRRDLGLAALVLSDLVGEDVAGVTRIEFEHSPGRCSPTYTNDGSAFDIFIEFVRRGGGSGFVGIEGKYHEPLLADRGRCNPLYSQRAVEMGCFMPDHLDYLGESALRQVWRDHLLAGSLMMAHGYESGVCVLLHPRDNTVWEDAATEYRGCLTDESTFTEWILEDVVDALRRHTAAEWVGLFHDRYLAFGKVDDALRSA